MGKTTVMNTQKKKKINQNGLWIGKTDGDEKLCQKRIPGESWIIMMIIIILTIKKNESKNPAWAASSWQIVKDGGVRWRWGGGGG